jgi:hypothetical protein
MADKKIWKKIDIESLSLHDSDKKYLSVHGLEIGDFGCVHVYPEFEFNKGIVLGYDGDVPIICSENGDGIFLHEVEKDRFVNTSAKQFALSINRFKLYCEQVEGIDDEEAALQIVNSAISGMKEIDELAWLDENNYWPVVGQQMIEGNL